MIEMSLTDTGLNDGSRHVDILLVVCKIKEGARWTALPLNRHGSGPFIERHKIRWSVYSERCGIYARCTAVSATGIRMEAFLTEELKFVCIRGNMRIDTG